MNHATVVAHLMLMIPLGACFLCASSGEQQGGSGGAGGQIVDLDHEPHHHFAFQNDKLRVFKVSVAPHAATLVHQHDRDYIFVSLGDTDISNEVVGKAPVEVKLKDGDMAFSKGNFAHLAKNLAATPFRNVTIELLQPAKGEVKYCDPAKEVCDVVRGNPCVVGGIVDCATTRWLIDAENFRVTETRIPLSLKIPKQTYSSGHLLVAITDLDLRDPAYGKDKKQLSLRAGDAVWMPVGGSEWMNAGKTPARFITLEFK